VILLDTHALIWWVNGGEELSPRARRTIHSSLADGPVGASAISVFEISTAVRRGRLDLGMAAERWLADASLLPDLKFHDVTPEIARLAGSFDASMPGDPGDRLIAATALSLGVALVTADDRLRRYPHLKTVW